MFFQKKKEVAIGIDFGTTKTAIGIYDLDEVGPTVSFIKESRGGVAELVKEFSFFPSVVKIESADEALKKFVTSVSKSAEGGSMRKDPFLIFSKFKLDMGELTFRESLNGPSLPAPYSIIEPWHAAATVLRYCRLLIEKATDDKILNDKTGITITVPATWDPEQRRATILAAIKAGFGKTGAKIELLEEPVAALLGIAPKFKEKTRVMVIDFGGGTCDLAIIDYHQSNLEIIATDTTQLGGEEIDEILLKDLWQKNEEELKLYGIDIHDPHSASEYYTLIQKVEEIKVKVNKTIVRLDQARKNLYSTLRGQWETWGDDTPTLKNAKRHHYEEDLDKLLRKDKELEDILDEELISKCCDILLALFAKKKSAALATRTSDQAFFSKVGNSIKAAIQDNFHEFQTPRSEQHLVDLSFSRYRFALFSNSELSGFLKKHDLTLKAFKDKLVVHQIKDDYYVDISNPDALKNLERSLFDEVIGREVLQSLNYNLTLAEFKKLLSMEPGVKSSHRSGPVVEHYKSFVEEMIENRAGGKGKIQRIYLVGGSSGLYFVRQVLEDIFKESLAEKLENVEDPRNKIAEGAARFQFTRQYAKEKLFDRVHPFDIEIETLIGTSVPLITAGEVIKGEKLESKKKKFTIELEEKKGQTTEIEDNEPTFSDVLIKIHRKNDFDNKSDLEKTLKFRNSVPAGTLLKVQAILRRDGILRIEASFPKQLTMLFNNCTMEETFPIFGEETTPQVYEGDAKRVYNDLDNFELEKVFQIHIGKGDKNV